VGSWVAAALAWPRPRGSVPAPAGVRPADQGIRQYDAPNHALKRSAAAVGECHRLLPILHRGRHPAQRQFHLAQGVKDNSDVLPFSFHADDFKRRPHWLKRLGQPAQGAQAVSRLVEHPGLSGFGQRWGHSLPRLLEKAGHRAQIRADRTEFMYGVIGTSQDAIAINLVARLLLQSRQAAVRHRLVERLQAGQSFRVMGCGICSFRNRWFHTARDLPEDKAIQNSSGAATHAGAVECDSTELRLPAFRKGRYTTESPTVLKTCPRSLIQKFICITQPEYPIQDMHE